MPREIVALLTFLTGTLRCANAHGCGKQFEEGQTICVWSDGFGSTIVTCKLDECPATKDVVKGR